MLQKDKQNIEKLLGTKDIQKGIGLIEVTLSKAADKIAACSASMESKASQLKQYEEENKDKNLENLVVIYSERFTDEWHVFVHAKQTFDVTTEFPIRDKRVARGIEEFEIDDEKHVKGLEYASL